MIKKEQGYESPTTDLINLRIDSCILQTSGWDSNNKTENLFDDGTITDL